MNAKKLRESKKASSFEDFDLHQLVMKNTLKKLLVTTIDRYLKHHKMNQCPKLTAESGDNIRSCFK